MTDEVKSPFLVVNKGVPPGSILGPILFTIYISNIATKIENCSVHFYADDTVLYSSAPSTRQALSYLQAAFNTIQRALAGLKLVLSASKTKNMIFSILKSDPIDAHLSTFNNDEIE